MVIRARPRIGGIKNTTLYCIDPNFDYRSLTPIVSKPRHLIDTQHIASHWDQAAHFFASIEAGKVTASTAKRRLIAVSSTNELAKACIIYWQALQISKLLKKHASELGELGFNLDSIAHISPVSWQDVTLYGQHHFNPMMTK